MNPKNNYVNQALHEWGLLEELNTELYEAMMDNDTETAKKKANQIKYRLLEIQRMYED
tara:strand:+ start:6597 stop:6770 length:174 start_codon:yes stop_codon:yes gene_type:complete